MIAESVILTTSDALYDWFASNDVCHDFALHFIYIFSTEEQRNSLSYVTDSVDYRQAIDSVPNCDFPTLW